MNRGAWLVTRKHPPSVGGMQQLSFHLVQGLVQWRPLTVIAWGRGQWGLPLLMLWAFARLLPALALGRVRVLHLGDPVLSALAVLPRLFGVPVAVTVHGLDIEHPSPLYQAYLKLFFWKRMQAYACISRHVRDLVLAKGVPPMQAVVIPVGIGEAPTERAAGEVPGVGADEGPTLLILGRLVERKGVAWFVREVAPALLRAHPTARLVVAGEGPQRAAIAEAVAAQGLQSRVVLTGAVDEPGKQRLFDLADLVLMPNIAVAGDAEGFGLVALEAGRAGHWPLVSDLEGLRDAVSDGRNGERIPPGDAAAWRAAIEQALSDLPAWRQRGEQARRYVLSQCSWSAMAKRYHQLFQVLEAHDH